MPSADALVLFGATGDLARRKLFPALHGLVKRGRLDVPVIALGRSAWNDEQLRAYVRESLNTFAKHVDARSISKLLSLLRYVEGDYRNPATFSALRAALARARQPLYYLAIPPSMFPEVISGLSAAGCAEGARVVVEKPFGRDLTSARRLNAVLHQVFTESSIFRIDHYLGKEAVQNLLYFRFANSFLEPLWNRNYVRSVQVTMAEEIGIAGRGHFYEEAGAIRDVVQNHMLQVVALLAMEAPINAQSGALQDERIKILRTLRSLCEGDLVRGQFHGYHDEDSVAPESLVETFVAMRLSIASWRWAGVPFFVRAGKCLPVTATEVRVDLHRPPTAVFGENFQGTPNYLRFRLSPTVETGLGTRNKLPGEQMVGENVELVACHRHADEMEAYDRLLGDALSGEDILFAREDVVEEAWRIVDPVLDTAVPPHHYAPQTWGPSAANSLTESVGGWHDPDVTPQGCADNTNDSFEIIQCVTK